jgi:hypothetical protein
MKTKKKAKTISFDILANGIVDKVRATPFGLTTGEIRYRVSVNEGPVHVFAWDEGLERWSIQEAGSTGSSNDIEMAIARMLQGNTVEMKVA